MAKKLGFGFMRLPLLDAGDPTKIDYKQLEKMVDSFMEKGFTYFDTAYMYHNYQSEVALRETLVKRYPRSSFTVADKMPTMFLKEKSDLERIFNEQLEKTGLEYFDYYMLHNLGVNHYEIAKKLDAFEFLQQKKAEGKVKMVGFSYHDSAELLDDILTEQPDVDFVQLQINYLDWNDPGIQSGKCYENAVKHGKPVIVMEPVKGGTLATVPPEAEKLFRSVQPELSVPSWAIRYAASLEHVMMVLSGMSSYGQIEDNISYMDAFEPLGKEEYETILKAVSIIKESVAIPCTACLYCMEGCPLKINIPKFFALYNAEKQGLNKDFSIQHLYYGNYVKDHAKASDCILCGKCESSCPQHIKIRKELKNVAEVFEKIHQKK